MSRGRATSGAALCLPLAAFLLGAFLLPLAGLVGDSLTPAAPPAVGGAELEEKSWDAAHYRRAWSRQGELAAFRNSFLLSACVAGTSILICFPAAWMLARHPFAGRALVRTLFAVPLTFSGVIVGFLAILVLGRLGLLPAVLGLLTGRPLFAGSAYTLAGLVAAYIYFEVPRAVLTLESALRRIDPELERAAATLGAGPRIRMLRVVWPQARGAVVSTLAVTFAASMGSFGVALVLARRLTLVPLSIYTEYTGFLDHGYAAALCLLLAATNLAANALLRASARGGAWIYD